MAGMAHVGPVPASGILGLYHKGFLFSGLSLRESFPAEKIRACLRNCFGVLDTLCFSLLTVLQDRAVSFYTDGSTVPCGLACGSINTDTTRSGD